MDINDRIKKEVNYSSFEELFNLFMTYGYSILNRKMGHDEYPELKWMLEYFEQIEDYEKCIYIKNSKKPKISNLKIEREREFLEAIFK